MLMKQLLIQNPQLLIIFGSNHSVYIFLGIQNIT